MPATLKVKIRLDGVREMSRAFRRLPKDASRELREETLKLSKDLAGLVKVEAVASSSQSALMAPTVKARRDRVPNIVAGGSRRVGKQRRRSSGQVPTGAYMILFGANFGARHWKQFRAWNGGAGMPDYWFFSTIEENQLLVQRAWVTVVNETLKRWGSDAY